MFLDSTFWFFVAFTIFLGLFGKKIWHALRDGLDTRSQKIEAHVAQAIQMHEKAQKLLTRIKQHHAEAEERANAIIDHARQETDRLKGDAEKELDDYMQRREKLAQERIDYAQAQAIKDIKRQSILLAITAAKKVLETKISDEIDQRLVQEAFQRLKQENPTRH